MLTVENFVKKPVLKGVSMCLEPGDVAILLGHSGVGKSTLLRIMNDLDTVDSGRILLNGKPLSTRDIGMVFQHFNLFPHLTCLENITVVSDNAEELLERYHLSEKRDVFPEKLSGGQKQRLAIARAVAMKPKVLCMDEPTSALDPQTTNRVAKNIQELSDEGYIILIATHDTALIDKINCTIHLMEGGEIVESASSKNYGDSPKIVEYLAGNR